jgi:hypothetical protein
VQFTKTTVQKMKIRLIWLPLIVAFYITDSHTDVYCQIKNTTYFRQTAGFDSREGKRFY